MHQRNAGDCSEGEPKARVRGLLDADENQHCGSPQRHIEGVGAEDVSEGERDGSDRSQHSGSDDGAFLAAKLGRESRYENHGGCRGQCGIEVNSREG